MNIEFQIAQMRQKFLFEMNSVENFVQDAKMSTKKFNPLSSRCCCRFGDELSISH